MNTAQYPKKKYVKLNLKKALSARMQGCSMSAIARQQGVSKTTVTKALNPIIQMMPEKVAEQLETYKADRVDILAAKQLELLQALSPDKITNASMRDIVTSMAILIDKERLIDGKSTSNLGVSVLLAGADNANKVHGAASKADYIEAEVLE